MNFIRPKGNQGRSCFPARRGYRLRPCSLVLLLMESFLLFSFDWGGGEGVYPPIHQNDLKSRKLYAVPNKRTKPYDMLWDTQHEKSNFITVRLVI